ncbi:hypothetical protein V1515DRAFT_539782, partial [Lipomyces mesembrius]
SSRFYHIHQRRAPVTEWLWAYFETTTVDREEIRCAALDNETAEKCGWKTTDSKRR